MTFLPVVPSWLLALAIALGLGLVWWPHPGEDRPSGSIRTWRRTALVVLVGLAALRPGPAGAEDVRADTAALDVFFVLDVSGSVGAEDHGGRSRLDGIRDDVNALSARLPGAHFTLITFDDQAVLRMPLTPDAGALAAAVAALRPEAASHSGGSDVSVAGSVLRTALLDAATDHPERPRVVFYFGDGEQTAGRAVQPLGVDRRLVAGGAVIGYGTTAGGAIPRIEPSATTVPTGGTRAWISDPATGERGVSRIDEAQLRDLAQQLGVIYLHATPGRSADDILARADLTRIGEIVDADGQIVGIRTELYWIPLLVVSLLLAWETGIAASELGATRRSSAPSRGVLARGDR